MYRTFLVLLDQGCHLIRTATTILGLESNYTATLGSLRLSSPTTWAEVGLDQGGQRTICLVQL